jgi:heptosyltransferase-1
VIEQNLSVAEGLVERPTGFIRSDVSDDFPHDPRTEAKVVERLAQYGIGDFVILNPGAGWGAKRWPAERYAEVANGLANLGVRSIINYGPGEAELARVAEAASRGAAQAMSCTISELIALTRRARLFIGGDTGPLHLAAALRVPVVAIYGPTDPARNGPYGTRSVVLRSRGSVTSHMRRAAADEGMLGIGSEAVVAAAGRLLGGDLRG